MRLIVLGLLGLLACLVSCFLSLLTSLLVAGVSRFVFCAFCVCELVCVRDNVCFCVAVLCVWLFKTS